MTSKEPSFIKSPYFVNEPGNWHLKPGAPKDVVKEFNDFMQGDEAHSVKATRILKYKGPLEGK